MKSIAALIKEQKIKEQKIKEQKIKESNNTIEYKVGFRSKMDASPIRVTVLVNGEDQKDWEKMVKKSQELYIDSCNGGDIEWED